MIKINPVIVHILVSRQWPGMGTSINSPSLAAQPCAAWNRHVSVYILRCKASTDCSSSGVHVHASFLSLPISPAVSILTILLPVSGFLINMFYSRHGPISSSSSNRVAKLAPLIIQVLQGLATTILATILFETILPSSTLDCMLETQWLHMFRSHDAHGIQSIQDAYDCCGLNTVKDKAYPFPPGKPDRCAQRYERDVACKGPWRGALQTTSGVDLVVVLAAGLIQVSNIRGW